MPNIGQDGFISDNKLLNKISVSFLLSLPLIKAFSRVIIHDRDRITFILGEAGDISTIASMDDYILIQTEPCLIRKTKHLPKYGIYIN